MSVVIVGGNECMIRQYKELCREYKCKAKIYPQMAGSLKDIGIPDILVLFTNTVSYKMVRSAPEQTKRKLVRTVCPHTSSINALRGILEEHMEGSETNGYA